MSGGCSIGRWARIGAETEMKLWKFILVCQEVRLDVMTAFVFWGTGVNRAA